MSCFLRYKLYYDTIYKAYIPDRVDNFKQLNPFCKSNLANRDYKIYQTSFYEMLNIFSALGDDPVSHPLLVSGPG